MARAPIFLPPLESFAGATTAYVDAAVAPKAPLASPAFTGSPTAPTPTSGDSSTKIATTAFVAALVPVGGIISYAGNTAPTGWHLCDGTVHGSSALQAISGSATTPDLRDRFIVGAGTSYARGNTGGAATVTLTAAQSGVAAHAHTASAGNQSVDHTHSTNPTQFTSGGQSANHHHWVDPASTGTTTAGAHQHTVSVAEGTEAAGDGDLWVDTAPAAGSGGALKVVGLTSTIGDHVHSVDIAGFNSGDAHVGHTHTIDVPATTSGGVSATHTHTVTVASASAAAASASHENRPPYYALVYIVRK